VTIAIIGLAIRLIPLEIILGPYPRLEGLCDTWFLLTQTQFVAHNYPLYTWFYPSIGFPDGLETIEMNPLLPFIAATILLLTEGVGKTDITILSFIPVICSLFLIPVMYFFGKTMHGKVAAVTAASLIIIIPSILSRTTLGYLDHHCFEILLSACFCYYFVQYIPLIISNTSDEPHKPVFVSRVNLIKIIIPSAAFFGLGIVNVVTMMVFFAIVMLVLTAASFVIQSQDFNTKRFLSTYYFIFLPSVVILLILGIVSHSSVIFHTYSILALALISGGIWIWIIILIQDAIKKHTSMIYYYLIIFIFSGIFFLITHLFIPQFWELAAYFFAYPYTLNLEWAPLSVESFIVMYGIALIPCVTGLIYCINKVLNQKSIQSLFIFIWFFFFLIAAFQHQRHLYYLDVPFVLLVSIGLQRIWECRGEFRSLCRNKERCIYANQIENTNLNAGNDSSFSTGINRRPFSNVVVRIIAILIFLGICFQFTTASYDVVTDDWTWDILNPDFIDAMVWLRTHSPDPGIDPNRLYTPDQFAIPSNAYSLITPWVYGYAAYYWSQRPVSTSGNKEKNGALVESLYGTRNYSYADEVMHALHGRYLVVSADFINDELAMYLLRGSQIPPVVSMENYLSFRADTSTNNEEVFYPEFYQPFYETLAIHLYLFDGKGIQGRYSRREDGLGSDSVLTPPYDLDSVQNFRLVYESNSTVTPYDGPVQDALRLFESLENKSADDVQKHIARVKIFEYIPHG